MQAVLKIGSSQYLVSEGQEILVDRPIIEEILMIIDGEKVHVGQPGVANAEVKLKVLGQERGEKLRITKYKAKSRYRKTRGFKAKYSRVLIENISLGGKSDKKEVTTTTEEPKKAAKKVVKSK